MHQVFHKIEVHFLLELAVCIVGYCNLMLPDDYEKTMRPSFSSNESDVVKIGLYIYKIGPVSETSMSMTTDVYFRQLWNDPRLKRVTENFLKDTSMNKGLDEVNIKGNYKEDIWKPNIYVVDSLQESSPYEISNSDLLMLSKDATLTSSKRVILTTRCPMYLFYFPLDSQRCKICFQSYEYSDNLQRIEWDLDILTLGKDLKSTATFNIDRNLKKSTTVEAWPRGNFTKLCVEITFNRKFPLYIVTMFLPSIALVVLSWVSFWIDKSAVPARAGLTITTILAQITLITGIANKFPGVADLKLGDVYMIVNFFFVFGSLIEFAIVNNTKKKTCEVHLSQKSYLSENIAIAHQYNTGIWFRCKKYWCNDRDLDNVSKILFPSAFLVWNILFVLVGLSITNFRKVE